MKYAVDNDLVCNPNNPNPLPFCGGSPLFSFAPGWMLLLYTVEMISAFHMQVVMTRNVL